MGDIFDMFAAEPIQYTGALWLWRSTQGVSVPGGPPVASIEAAEGVLRTFSQEPGLMFVREHHEVDEFASATYDEGADLAVVIRESTSDIVSYARLPDGFLR